MNEFEYIASLEAEKERVKEDGKKIVEQLAQIPFSDLEKDFASQHMKTYAKLEDVIAVRIALAKERTSKDAWDEMPLYNGAKEDK